MDEARGASVTDGWYVVRPSLVGNPEDWDTVYHWNSRQSHSTREKAISAGWKDHGHDDWNLGQFQGGALVWWGWMDEQHPSDDREYVAQRLGVLFGNGDLQTSVD